MLQPAFYAVTILQFFSLSTTGMVVIGERRCGEKMILNKISHVALSQQPAIHDISPQVPYTVYGHMDDWKLMKEAIVYTVSK